MVMKLRVRCGSKCGGSQPRTRRTPPRLASAARPDTGRDRGADDARALAAPTFSRSRRLRSRRDGVALGRPSMRSPPRRAPPRRGRRGGRGRADRLEASGGDEGGVVVALGDGGQTTHDLTPVLTAVVGGPHLAGGRGRE